MYRRITAVVAATAAAVLLVATPAWADLLEPEGLPSLPPGLVTVEPVGEPPACVGEPFEIAPAEWDCVTQHPDDGGPVPGPDAEWLASCIDEPVEEEPGLWTCTLEVPADEAAPEDEPTADPEPEPEPVDIVEGDGDWGWSDAREMYRG